MSDLEPEPLVLALRLADPDLIERLATLLGDVPGLRLAASGEVADVVLVAPAAAPVDPELDPALTAREREVLGLLAEGASNKAIARRLGISAHTVKFHVAGIFDKLDASGRTDAVAYAMRRGVLNL